MVQVYSPTNGKAVLMALPDGPTFPLTVIPLLTALQMQHLVQPITGCCSLITQTDVMIRFQIQLVSQFSRRLQSSYQLITRRYVTVAVLRLHQWYQTDQVCLLTSG